MDGEFPSERYVFSRLVYDLSHGTDAQGGFMVRYPHTDMLYKSTEREDYAAFKKQIPAQEKKLEVYTSHAGLQDDLVFPLWRGLEWVKARILEYAKEGSRWQVRLQTLDIYYYNMIAQGVVALVNALALSLFVLWAGRRFSPAQGWVLLALMVVLLPPLSFFGRSLWWMMWSWFVPMLSVLWLLGGARRAPGAGRIALAALLSGAGVCLKTLMGFEYVSTVMAAALVPVVFYMLEEGWTMRRGITAGFVIGMACLAGFAAAFALYWHALQDFGLDPAEIIRERFEMRAYGGESLGDTGEILKSTQSSFWGVLGSYLISPKKMAVPQILLMAPFLCRMWRYYRGGLRQADTPETRRLHDAFAAAIALSFLGAVSMLVILKGHSYIHGFDIVVWCLPLNLFLLTFYARRITADMG